MDSFYVEFRVVLLFIALKDLIEIKCLHLISLSH
jgi:hypothetical protein